MRIGIFGSSTDPQCQAVARELERLGAEPLVVEYDALDRGLPLSMERGAVTYCGETLDDIRGWFMRFIPAPYAPYIERDGDLLLFPDWFERYMQARERASFFVSWLLQLVHEGHVLVNPPQAASVLQYKPFQLQAFRRLGAPIPRTLISNDPDRVSAFREEVGEVVFKPIAGGAPTELLEEEALSRLDTVRSSPVIFQERVPGDDLRVMLVGDEIVSAVVIETGSACLDFREDPVYSAGQARYREVQLPPEAEEQCRAAARACGLAFAGIDIKSDGERHVFLELNSSPIYLDVELKLGHRISEAIARHVLARVRTLPGG